MTTSSSARELSLGEIATIVANLLRVFDLHQRDERCPLRARVANRVVAQQATKLEADVEQQLGTRYKIDEATWAELTLAATRTVEQADSELAKWCWALGTPEEFRPSLHASWHDRGENANAKRRTELRQLAVAEIDVLTQQARVAIESAALDGLTWLAVGALESAEAQAFLATMPTVEALMPALDVSALGPLALPGAGVRRADA